MSLEKLPPFYVGQKVVCIYSFEDVVRGESLPMKGCKYTVRDTEFIDGDWWVRLFEIRNADEVYDDGVGECQFWAEKFVPIQQQDYPLMTFEQIKKVEKQEILILN